MRARARDPRHNDQVLTTQSLLEPITYDEFFALRAAPYDKPKAVGMGERKRLIAELEEKGWVEIDPSSGYRYRCSTLGTELVAPLTKTALLHHCQRVETEMAEGRLDIASHEVLMRLQERVFLELRWLHHTNAASSIIASYSERSTEILLRTLQRHHERVRCVVKAIQDSRPEIVRAVKADLDASYPVLPQGNTKRKSKT